MTGGKTTITFDPIGYAEDPKWWCIPFSSPWRGDEPGGFPSNQPDPQGGNEVTSVFLTGTRDGTCRPRKHADVRTARVSGVVSILRQLSFSSYLFEYNEVRCHVPGTTVTDVNYGKR